MPATSKQWSFDYTDIARATGQSVNYVTVDKNRGEFDPQRIESVVIYLAKNGTLELRTAMFHAYIETAKEAKEKRRRRKRAH